MEVHFDNDKLERLFASERSLVRQYGRETTMAIARRLTALVQSPHLAEAIKLGGRIHPLKGDRAGQYACDLPNGKRLILRPNSPVPRLEDGGIDLAKVTAVTVVEISDHYKN